MFSGLSKTHIQLDLQGKAEITGVIFCVLDLYAEYQPQHSVMDLEDIK